MRTIVVLVAVLSLGLVAEAQAAPSGCKRITYTHHQPSLTHASTMFEMYLKVEACYSEGHVTRASAVCWISNVDSFSVQHSGCGIQEQKYGWGGNWDGGYLALGSASFSNCFFKYGCWRQGTLTMFVYVTANGAISTRKET